MRQNVAEALKMPVNYAVMSEEEMAYLEGGYTHYKSAKCKNKYYEALSYIDMYSRNIGGNDATNTGSYLNSALAIQAYNYASKKYYQGWKNGHGVNYYYLTNTAKKIVVCTSGT